MIYGEGYDKYNIDVAIWQTLDAKRYYSYLRYMLLAIPELTNYIIPFEVSKGCLYKLKKDDLDVCYVYIDMYYRYKGK